MTTDFDLRVPVRADADRLHQAVTNLLANAAPVLPTRHRVHLRAHADGTSAVLEVGR